MNTMMTTERMGMMGMPMGMQMPMNAMPAMMSGANGMMLPRCTMKMEKMAGGMKCTMMCEDKTAATMMQQLCMMNANGMMGMCCMMNGMMCCQCMMPMGTCKMEMMEMGCMMTCTSGDAMAGKMIQACCDCMTSMMMPGCTIYMMMNGMPMCCCVC